MFREMNHQFYNFSEFKHMFSDPRFLADNLGICHSYMKEPL